MRPPHTLPYAYFSLLPPDAAVRAIAGVGRVGQAPTAFPAELAQSIAANLAAMIWVPDASQSAPNASGYTAYSPGSYEVNFGTPPPAAPGYPDTATGAYVLADENTAAPVDALTAGRPLDRIDVVVTRDASTATLFTTEDEFKVVLSPSAAALAKKKGISTAAIVAGLAAAAVAALLIFA
jgi:hypothetical protein